MNLRYAKRIKENKQPRAPRPAASGSNRGRPPGPNPRPEPVPFIVTGPPEPVLPEDATNDDRRQQAREYLQQAAVMRRLPLRDLVAAKLLVRCAVAVWPDCALLNK